MADRYEMELVVHISFDFANEADEVFEHFVDKLYDDKHPNYWVNHIAQQGQIKAYDSVTGEDL